MKSFCGDPTAFLLRGTVTALRKEEASLIEVSPEAMKTKGTELSESCIIKMRLTGKEKIIALAGNPNVGKSTLFNFLTGMRQHTGNWPGKTVGCAAGIHRFKGNDYLFVDLPGAYSLSPTSPEEEAAEEYIALGKADVVIAVCDATSLEKSLSLAFQVKETGAKTIICVTLTDEAQKKGIEINYKKLSEITGVPVIPVCAKIGKGIPELLEETEKLTLNGEKIKPARLKYQRDLEKEISRLSSLWVRPEIGGRFAAEKFLEKGKSAENIRKRLAIRDDSLFLKEVKASEEILRKKGFDSEKISDELALAPIKAAEKAARETVSYRKEEYDKKDRLFDKILTGKYTAVPLMCLMLLFIFWLTISAANYPSELLGKLLFSLEKPIFDTLKLIGVPIPFCDMISHGMYRVLAWVVSVMLPPMAIFFPLFTLLEDLGYLPRIAFNLDLPFKQAGTCGKQALTMCMGFGCNAAGVTGTRIISSPRERLIAVITNNFVPCNGRFPTLIAIITMFFTAGKSSFSGAVYLTLIIILGVCVTLAASSFLSKTLLKGVPSFFTLELPPYRTPQVGKVIVRSVFDRTLFVLGRAAAVAARRE